jgi:thioredoxin-related protein
MKRWVLLIGCLLFFGRLMAQLDTARAPYLRFPTHPPMQLLLGDSTTKYTKADLPSKKPVLLMLFSPECSHCQHTAEEMVQQKDALQNIHIVMATLHSISQMNAFAKKYGLDQMPNVVLGKDIYYILPSYYNIRNLPYLAFYDKNGDLIMGFEGAMPLRRVVEVFEKKR